MGSIYHFMMDLPLFKGLGENQLSDFLEHTKINFANYSRDEAIYLSGEYINEICFLFSGKIRLEHYFYDSQLKILERRGEKALLGADGLFGINNTYINSIYAESDVSMMTIDKQQFLKVLELNKIFLLNFLNYLSAKSQHLFDFYARGLKDVKNNRLLELINCIATPFTESIEIIATDSFWAKLCNCPEEEIRIWKAKLTKSGEAKCTSESIHINAPFYFLKNRSN